MRLRSPNEVYGDRSWSNTSKSSLELNTSTSSSSFSSSFSFSLMIGREEEASTLGIPSSIELVEKAPSSIGPMVRKPGVATLIC